MDNEEPQSGNELGARPAWLVAAMRDITAGGEPVESSPTTTFGAWLRAQRKEHDLTQEALAERAGCSWETLRKIEGGAARPSRQLAELLATALAIPPAERARFVQWARGGQRDNPDPSGAPPLAPGPIALPNPYKGLRAFQEADAPDFFGREALTAHLLTRLAADEPFARFLAIVGPSGSGKSSVVRAGLVPALRHDGVPGSARWTTVEVVPGPHPFDELEAALLRCAINPPPSLLPQLREDERGLLRAVKRTLPADPGAGLLLLIDQFEELFTLVADEATRAHFLNSLYAAVAEPRSPLRVVVTLRADFYDRPLLYAQPAALLGERTEVVPPLASDELERAIVGPAGRVGVSLEPELLATLIADTGAQPGLLPLLQYALTELFERREGIRLTLAAYRASGGVIGALGRRAEGLYQGLSPAEQAETRQLFLRLVTLGEGVEDTRRRTRRSELASAAADEEALDRVLEVFGRYRLLTFDRDPTSGGPTVEVAHEALLHSWGRLGDWLTASRESLRVQRRLLVATGEWAAGRRDASYLASGARLEQFAALAAAGELALTAEERAYLATSQAAQEQQALAERDRLAHELELARQAATAAEEAAAAQRSAASRLRGLVGALVLFLLVAAGLALFAFNQSQVAQNNAVEANTQRGLAQNSAATAVASETQAQANFQRAYALRLAAEANTQLHAGGTADLIALLSIRSLQTLYSPQADADLVAAAALDYPLRRFTEFPDGGPLHVAFSPDGKYLAFGTGSPEALLFDVQTGRPVRRFTGHTGQGQVGAVAISPDGRYLLTGGADRTARLWELQTGRQVQLFVGHTGTVYNVAFSPDGKTIATGAGDGTGRLWDVQTGTPLRILDHHNEGVADMAFSPDGRFVATAGADDNTAWLWDVPTGQALRRFRGHTAAVLGVAFSPDGQYLATSGQDNTARLWDAQTGAALRVFAGHSNGIQFVVYSPDGKELLTSSFDHTARFWNVQTGQELRRLQGHTDAVIGVAFSPDGRYAATTSFDQTAALWDLQAHNGRSQLKAPLELIQAVFSPDSTTVLTAGQDGRARLWDAGSGQEIRSLTVVTGGVALYATAFSPDGKTIATGSNDGRIGLWDLRTGQQVRAFTTAPPLPVNDVRFAPDGKTILTIHYSSATPPDPQANVGILWDAQTGREVRRFVGHTARLLRAAYSPDSQYMLTSSEDKTARLWDARTGAQVQEFDHPQRVTEVGFSADGHWAVTGCDDGVARIWEVRTGHLIAAFDSQGGSAVGAAISPDGRYLLVGLEDHTARLWEIATRQEVRRFVGHSGPVAWVAVAPDGKSLVIAGGAWTAELWDVDYHDTIRTLCARLTRDFTAAERAQYEIQGPTPTCPRR